MADRHRQHSGDTARKGDHTKSSRVDRGAGISPEIGPPVAAKPPDRLKPTNYIAGYRLHQPRAQTSRDNKRRNQGQGEHATDGVRPFPPPTALSIYRSKEPN